MSAEDAVDLLVLSAFPNDYIPTLHRLGALFNKGLSVDDLARNKAVDLRQAFSCWLSRPIQITDPDPLRADTLLSNRWSEAMPLMLSVISSGVGTLPRR